MLIYSTSPDFPCVVESQCGTWLPKKTGLKAERIIEKAIISPWGKSIRKFAEVQTSIGRYLADVVTGSLYCTKTGRCLTSERIHII